MTKAWILALAIVATPVAANHYAVIAVSEEQGVMATIDLDSIKTVGAYQRAWGLTVIYEPPLLAPVSAQTLTEYDCKQDRSRILSSQQYNSKHDFVRDTGAEDWSYVAPETGGSVSLSFACGKVPDPNEVVTLTQTDLIEVFKKNVDAHTKAKKR